MLICGGSGITISGLFECWTHLIFAAQMNSSDDSESREYGMNGLQPSRQQPVGRDEYLFLGAVAFLCLCYMFSPLASYLGALLYLTVFSHRLSTRVRIATGVVVIISAASIWASREVGRNASDDFEFYYDMYRRVGALEWGAERIPVYEFGLPLLFRIIRIGLPDLTPNGLMFVLTSVTGLILLFCVERFGLTGFARGKRAYCVAMALLFFSFVLTTQLTRQMLSSAILVLAFFSLKALPRGLWVLLASVVHVSAVGVYAVVRVFQSRHLLITMVLVSVVVGAHLIDLEAVASLLGAYGVPRVGYYLTMGDSGANAASLDIVLVVALAGLLSILVCKAANARVLWREKRLMALLVGVIIVYLLSLNVILGPFRLFLVIHAVMAGWIFAFFTRRFATSYLVVGGVLLILWKARSLYFTDPSSAFLPWGVYGPFGAVPGYFVLSYFTN